MNLFDVNKTRIHCDVCHYEFSGDAVEWHNRNCLECGAPNIITDMDVGYHLGVMDTINFITLLAQNNPDGIFDGDIPPIVFNTSNLRERLNETK